MSNQPHTNLIYATRASRRLQGLPPLISVASPHADFSTPTYPSSYSPIDTSNSTQSPSQDCDCSPTVLVLASMPSLNASPAVLPDRSNKLRRPSLSHDQSPSTFPSSNSKVRRQLPLTQIDQRRLARPFNECNLNPGTSMSSIVCVVSKAASCSRSRLACLG